MKLLFPILSLALNPEQFSSRLVTTLFFKQATNIQ